MTLSAVKSDAACFGGSTGSIDLTPAGGTEPYLCIWSNGESTEDVKDLAAGEYSVFVTDAAGCSAETSFKISQPATALNITVQPLPQTDCYGNQVEFTVSAGATVGAVNYQWQQMPPSGTFSDISGVVTGTLTIDQIGVNGLNIHGTQYRVIITDQCGSITSNSALLTINSITGLTPSSVNSTICTGGTITYSAAVQGSLPAYQWAFNPGSAWNILTDGAVYSGTATSSLSISNSTTAQTGSYRVTVTFATLNQPSGYPTCTETSTTRTRNLVVRAPVSISITSGNQQVCTGDLPSSLTAGAASGGSGPSYSYQWQTSSNGTTWNDITGQTALSCSPSLLSSNTYFRISATDGGTPACGKTYSSPVLVTVNPLPVTSSINHR